MILQTLEVQAPAKINLGLWVTGRRDDGFHDLLTVFQTVNLLDTLRFTAAPEGTADLVVSNTWAPRDDSNLVLGAVRLLWDAIGRRPGIKVHLEKRIPSGAGLGGGSSDAAATLKALGDLWNLDLSPDDLHALALKLGSDVPFFLECGTAMGQGRGERLSTLTLPAVPWGWILVLPSIQLSTKDVFQHLPQNLPKTHTKPEFLQKTIESGDLAALGRILENHLEPAAGEVSPRIDRLREALEATVPPGSVVSMSGSGSAFYILTPTEADAQRYVEDGQFWSQAPWAQDSRGKLAVGEVLADTDSLCISFILCSPMGTTVS